LSRPFPSRQPPPPQYRINGKIRAREVRVIDVDGQQLGVLDLSVAISKARAQLLDLVEIAASANPPVCRIVDFGKFKYEQAKREGESKKHHSANTVKEVQLSARIGPHDLGIKLDHSIAFLCDDMKVKVALRFRGREMAHTEIGKAVVDKFLKEIAPWGHPDFPPRLVGRSINVMISPLPRQKRAKNPKEGEELRADPTPDGEAPEPGDDDPEDSRSKPAKGSPAAAPAPRVPTDAAERPPEFGNSAFSGLALPPA
jgi:translation initiation factor IF-3